MKGEKGLMRRAGLIRRGRPAGPLTNGDGSDKVMARKNAAVESQPDAAPPARHGPPAPMVYKSPLDRLRAVLKLSADADLDAVCETALNELDRLSVEGSSSTRHRKLHAW